MANTEELRIKINSSDAVKAADELEKLSKSSAKAEQSTNKTTESFITFNKILAGGAIIGATEKLIKYADAYTTLSSRIKLTTNDTNEQTKAIEGLYQISQKTRTGFKETADLYSRIALSTKDMNLSQKDMLTLTETINKSMILSGGTAESMNSAIIQLGQAFSADFKSVGQELGSIREQTPALYQAIVKGSGMSSSAFRKAAEEGKLSNEIIINSLKKMGVEIDKNFGKINTTVGQSKVVLENSFTKIVGQFDNATGASATLSGAIIRLSSSLDGINVNEVIKEFSQYKDIVLALGLSYVSYVSYMKMASLATVAFTEAQKMLTVTTVSLDVATGAEIATIRALTVAEAMATVGTTALSVAMKTIPFVAVGAGLLAIADHFLTASKNADILADSIGKSTKELANLTKNQLEANKIAITSELQSKREEQQRLSTKIRQSIYDNGQKAPETIQLRAEFDTLSKSILQANEALNKTEDTIKNLGTIKAGIKKEQSNEDAEEKKRLVAQREADKEAREKAAREKANQKEKIVLNKMLQESLSKIDAQKAEALKGTKNSLQDAEIEVKYEKEKLNLLEKSNSLIRDNKSINNQKVNVSNAEKNLLDEQEKSQKEALKKQEEYYKTIGDYAKGWELKKQIIAKENLSLKKEELSKLLEVEKTNYFEPVKKLQQEKDKETRGTAKAKFEAITTNKDTSSMAQLESDITDLADKYTEAFNNLEDKSGESSEKLTTDYIKATKEITDEIENLKKIDITINLKGIDTVTNGISSIVNSFGDLQDISKKYEEQTKRLKKGDEDYNKVALNTASNQISAYSNMTGAMSTFFTNNEEAQKNLMKVQQVMFVAQMAMELQKQFAYGTTAMAASLTLPPPASFAAFVATGAMLASLGIMVGGAISGGDKVTNTYDAFSAQKANKGKGSVLGDVTAQSSSITKSLDLLSNYAKPEFTLLANMNKSLISIDQKIGGMAGLLVRQGGYAFGEGFNAYNGSSKNNLFEIPKATSLLGGIAGKALEYTAIGLVNKGWNAIIGGLFGTSKTSKTLEDSGITFADQLLTNAKDSFEGSAYQTIKTTTEKKSYFGKSTKNSFNTNFQDLNGELENQFSLVLNGLYNTTVQAGNALDTSSKDVENSLANFVVQVGKISLKGKTGDEIQKNLEAIFGQIGDDIAKTAFPMLSSFQKVGEGLFDTMSRVSVGMQEADYYINRLGVSFSKVSYLDIANKQGTVSVEALSQSIQNSNKSTHELDNSLVGLLSSMGKTAEEVYGLYSSFSQLGDMLEFLKGSSLFLTTNMITGAGSTDALSGGVTSYIDKFMSQAEQTAYKVSAMNNEFEKLGLTAPKTRDEFKALLNSFDLTTQSGQELYGRVVTLSSTFDATAKSVEDMNASISNTYSIASALIASSKQTISNFILTQYEALRSSKTTIKSYIDDLRGYTTNISKSFEDAYSYMVKAINDKSPDIATSISTAIASSKTYLDNFSKTAIAQRDIDFQKLIIANKFNSVNLVVDKTMGDLYNQAQTLLGSDSDLVKYLKLINGNTSTLTFQQYKDNLAITQALTMVNDSINSMVLGGVQLSILQDDKGVINALVANNFTLKVGDGWDSIVSSLNAGFNWNIGEFFDGVKKASVGDKLSFDWNKDGINEAVATVLPNGTTKLEFDWNNDKTVDLSAIIGKDGQLETIATNTDGNNGTSISDYLNFLYQIEKDKMAKEQAPLSQSSFEAGHVLGTNEKIDFAKATGITLGSKEFDTAISDIQGFSTRNLEDNINFINNAISNKDVSLLSSLGKLQPLLPNDIQDALNFDANSLSESIDTLASKYKSMVNNNAPQEQKHEIYTTMNKEVDKYNFLKSYIQLEQNSKDITTVKDLGLNYNNGGVFKEMLKTFNDIKSMMVTQTATQLKTLSTQRSILGEVATA